MSSQTWPSPQLDVFSANEANQFHLDKMSGEINSIVCEIYLNLGRKKEKEEEMEGEGRKDGQDLFS